MHAAIFSDQMQPARPLERFDLQLFDRLVDIIRFTPASESERTAVEAAARAIGQQTEVFSASTETDIERAFPAIAQRYLGALLVFVTGDPFFFTTRKYLVALAASYAIPTIYWAPEYVDQGGLISYGAISERIQTFPRDLSATSPLLPRYPAEIWKAFPKPW
jgi:hypothetical protein